MKPTDFGFPTLIEHDNLEESIDFCVEHKLQFIEINMNMPQYQISKINKETLKKGIEKGIYFTFHLDENFNVCDFNEKVSLAYMETALETIALAKEINAPVINMHMHEGIHFKLPHENIFLFEKYNDFYMERLKNFRYQCETALKGSETKICIENTGGFRSYMEKGIAYLLESSCFFLTLDIGHLHCADNTDHLLYEKYKEKLMHIHLHDAEGKKCHLPLFSGTLDIHKYIVLAKEKGCRCVLETKSIAGLVMSLERLRNI